MITLPLSLLVAHFIGDFLLQSDWMATNKSKSSAALLTHCAIYSLCFLYMGVTFAFATFVLHVHVDYWTSRLTTKLWFFRPLGIANPPKVWQYVAGTRHWFFIAIGFDQLLHAVALAATFHYLT